MCVSLYVFLKGWKRGSCNSAGYSQKINGTLGSPEFIKMGERMPAY